MYKVLAHIKVDGDIKDFIANRVTNLTEFLNIAQIFVKVII